MYGRIFLVLIVCFGVAVNCHGGGLVGRYKKIKACCPSIPSVINWDSLKSCKPPKPERSPDHEEGENREATEDAGEATNEDSEESEDGPGVRPTRGGERWKQHKNRSCAMECAFKKEGYITTGEDGKNAVDLAALNTKLTSLATGQWATVMEAVKANCTGAPPEVNPKRTCTSGASEIAKCYLRIMAAQCPDPKQTSNCTEKLARMSQEGGRRDRKRNRKDRKRNRGRDGEDTTTTNNNNNNNNDDESSIDSEA